MLQYIINTSIIWLACLLVYELLLRKERFHQYNRIFLLCSLAVGLLLPLVNLSSLLPTDNKFRQPAAQVQELKRAMFVPVALPEADTPSEITAARVATPAEFDYKLAFLALYLVGVLIGVIVMLRESFYLVRLYTGARRSRQVGYTVVMTGKTHCPFSFFRLVFVRSRDDYSETQWAWLIAHEREHSRQLHSLDNLMLVILRIVFWFHPLPYIYYKRLVMLHEFQADHAAATNPADYGVFLLEQGLLKGVPVLAHSINYSPIKKRIAMLTGKRSTRNSLLKYLAAIPLSVILLVFCTQASFSGERSMNSKKVLFKGSEITFEERKVYPDWYYNEVLSKQMNVLLYAPKPDSIPHTNWATGEVKMGATPVDTVPIALNGQPIYGDEHRYALYNGRSVYTVPLLEGQTNPEQHLFTRLKEELNKLEDGYYRFELEQIVVDQTGKIAYYESNGIMPLDQTGMQQPIREDLRNIIDEKLIGLLNGPLKFQPAMKDGKPINARVGRSYYQIEVRNHVARLLEMKGC